MNETKICVIGLGYVGLPLARLFSTKYKTIGFDMNQARVTALMAGHDATLEVSDELLQSALANGFKCTANIEEIRDYNFYVVAVPTPVDKNNNPDLTPLYGASTTVGSPKGILWCMNLLFIQVLQKTNVSRLWKKCRIEI